MTFFTTNLSLWQAGRLSRVKPAHSFIPTNITYIENIWHKKVYAMRAVHTKDSRGKCACDNKMNRQRDDNSLFSSCHFTFVLCAHFCRVYKTLLPPTDWQCMLFVAVIILRASSPFSMNVQSHKSGRNVHGGVLWFYYLNQINLNYISWYSLDWFDLNILRKKIVRALWVTECKILLTETDENFGLKLTKVLAWNTRKIMSEP